MSLVPFRARARTVDHLGREQIADCPTAVSELWKNAYDAYATQVSLAIFDSPVPVALIQDDGHGMSRAEFEERWLMLGTESKAGKDDVSEGDKNGLATRIRQGQKGIGRLSVAYLGPTVLVLSKRKKQPYVAALIDWRLFENPHLFLNDVQVPVEGFRKQSELPGIIDKLLEGLLGNVWGPDDDEERKQRIITGWEKYTEEQASLGQPPTAEAITELAFEGKIEDRFLEVWPAWNGRADQGTALIIFDVGQELRVWVDRSLDPEDSESKDVRSKLRFTLTGFIDPFSPGERNFHYRASAFSGDRETSIVDVKENFGTHDLDELEHVVKGTFNNMGVFSGTVKAWGKTFEHVQYVPRRPPPLTGGGAIGPFEICLGTFEQEAKSSTHSPDVISKLKDQASAFGGLAVYRDRLRVQPYGRPEVDFLGMEERRSKHAGREFWAHRRTFGRIALSTRDNPHLRDKAGREGLIDNRASREFKLLVTELLKDLARRFYGQDSDLRASEVEVQKKRFAAAQKAAEAAKRKRVSYLKNSLKGNRNRLIAASESATLLLEDIEHNPDHIDLESVKDKLESLRSELSELRLPPKPKRLNTKVEMLYREFRDILQSAGETLEQASAAHARVLNRRLPGKPEDIATEALNRHQKAISDSTARWLKKIKGLLKSEAVRWTNKTHEDKAKFYRFASPVVQDVVSGGRNVLDALRELDNIRNNVLTDLTPSYESYMRSVDLLAAEIDVDAALGWATDEVSAFEERFDRWQSLAQLGITVEIVGHELNDTARQIARSLARLPKAVRSDKYYKSASEGFKMLVHRLEFLSPLRLSGERVREEITGARLETYLRDFFAQRMADQNVRLIATDDFRDFAVTDYPHRIFPVFTNLINNSIYWTAQGDTREIRLDCREGLVYVADTGPGVPADDIESLFTMFFTTRPQGHGVGLYLARINLAHGRHAIRYANEMERITSGANFILEFKGVSR